MHPLPFTLGKDKTDLSLHEKLALFGPSAIPLIIPYGSKGQAVPGSPWNRYMKDWNKRTLEQTQTPQYQADLYSPLPKNVAIRQGGGLTDICAWDFDTEDGDTIEEFMAANPFVRSTIMTVGARGFTAWIKIDGDYPRHIHKIGYDHAPAVEWRGNGYSVIHGLHPSGKVYQLFIL
jgi:hypothetical protein